MTPTTMRVIGGPCVTPILNGDVARVVELPTGGLRIEWWVKGAGWTEAPEGGFNLADFVPGDTKRPVLEKDAIRLGCRSRGFRQTLDGGNRVAAGLRKDRRPDQRAGVGSGLPPGAARQRLVGAVRPNYKRLSRRGSRMERKFSYLDMASALAAGAALGFFLCLAVMPFVHLFR
jgi:hypothetical protein